MHPKGGSIHHSGLVQAVALVFDHVGSAHAAVEANGGGSPQQANGVASKADAAFPRLGPALLAQQGSANAALKLLDDLCMMATGLPPIAAHTDRKSFSHFMAFTDTWILAHACQVGGPTFSTG